MSPYWEKRFAQQSFACRSGRGPMMAAWEVRDFMRGAKRHSARRLYCLKVDVAGFFPSIDRGILKGIILRKLKHPLFRYLVIKTIDHKATDKGNYILKSKRHMWQAVAKHKSLFHTETGKGLPIGNLTSQFFANIYLNELDQALIHHIKKVYWQRYVDDLLFVSEDLDELRALPLFIDGFLRENLALKLNPKKTILQPACRGVDHLGFFIKPYYMLVRRKNVRHCKAKLAGRLKKGYSPHRRDAMMASYLGLFGHGDGFRLCQAIRGYSLAVDLIGESNNLKP